MSTLEHRPEISKGKQAAFQVISGGIAGFVEVCLMQPLDVVKTRMQLQSKPAAGSSEVFYNGVFDCFAKMYRQEGLLSFWKGVVPPILVETPRRAMKFLLFEQTRQFYQFNSPTPTPLSYALAGMTAGLLEGIVITPFEVVKVTQQADRQRKVSSTYAVAREIIGRDGFGKRGLLKGLTATVSRHGVFNTIFFGFFYTVKNMVPMSDNSTWELLRKFFIGFTAGTLGCLCNTPFDVAKSRIQGPQPVPGEIKYHGTLRTLGMVYRGEGIRGLYKGLLPKIMRLGPGGAIMLLTFDYVYKFLVDSTS